MSIKRRVSSDTLNVLKLNFIIIVIIIIVLIGTTFAWFASSLEAKTDMIQSGILDVLLVDKDGNSLDGTMLKFVGNDDKKILWEPGVTYDLPEVYVKNNGNLSLKYYIEIDGVDGSEKLLEAIEWTINGYDVEAEHILIPSDISEKIIISGHMKEDAGNEYQGLSISGLSIKVHATQITEENS